MTAAVDAAAYRQREEEGRDAAETMTFCFFCPKWSHTGTAKECREAAVEHRANEHPDIPRMRRRRSTRSLKSFALRELTNDEWFDINEERRKRALLTGVILID